MSRMLDKPHGTSGSLARLPRPPTCPPPATAAAPGLRQVWAVRESLCELALGQPAHRLTALPHYALTAALAGAAYAVSLAVPSIYVRGWCQEGAGLVRAGCAACSARPLPRGWRGGGLQVCRRRFCASAPGLCRPTKLELALHPSPSP